ncbi:MAG: undecaprenyl-diphosphate phosphatase [Gammaproteobacteria bacterium]|nr:undecaprenyl-diphosphate phosphatase [Gammaproteobacteria bacterium]
METSRALLLGLLQGLTEFLPVSSSAHLILVPQLLGWEDQGLAFDVAVHLGTLTAVLWYFRRPVLAMTQASWDQVRHRKSSADARLTLAVVVATIPAGVGGLLLNDLIEGPLRSPLVIATTTVIFGLLLGWADHKPAQSRDENSLRWPDILIIGSAQALALIPGTSRSGITMTAALFCGLNRAAAARFSFLLSIPLILAAGGMKGLDLLQSPQPIPWAALTVGTVSSAISAYLCITLLLRWLGTLGFGPFVLYRLLLGGVLFTIYL